MSIDRRLRTGLQHSAEAIRSDVSGALHAVEHRARRRRRVVTTARLAAAAAAAVVLAVVGTMAVHRLRGAGTDVMPAGPPPVGTYVVDVPISELAQRQGMAGRWVVTLRSDGVLQLTPPEAFTGNPYGASYQTDGDVLRTNAFISSPGCQRSSDQIGTYRWVRTATELIFNVVADTCDARRLLFGGQAWEVS